MLKAALSLLSFFWYSLSFSHESYRDASTFTSYPADIEEAISSIHQLPEARALIDKVQKKTPISIRFSQDSTPLEAFWDSKSHSIILGRANDLTEGSLVRSILFELHNANSNELFSQIVLQAYHRTISKQEYIEKIERLEHANALQTMDLLEKGIQEKIFPESARWYVVRDFSDHFQLQKDHGHSDWLAKQYDSFAKSPLRG